MTQGFSCQQEVGEHFCVELSRALVQGGEERRGCNYDMFDGLVHWNENNFKIDRSRTEEHVSLF